MKHISLADSSEMERLLHIIYNLLLNTVTLTNCSDRRRRKKFPVCVTAESCALGMSHSWVNSVNHTPQSSQPRLNWGNGDQFWAGKQKAMDKYLNKNHLLYWKSVSQKCVSCKKRKDWN